MPAAHSVFYKRQLYAFKWNFISIRMNKGNTHTRHKTNPKLCYLHLICISITVWFRVCLVSLCQRDAHFKLNLVSSLFLYNNGIFAVNAPFDLNWWNCVFSTMTVDMTSKWFLIQNNFFFEKLMLKVNVVLKFFQ